MLGTVKSQTDFQITDSTLYLKAIQLSKDFLIVDTHIDLPSWLYNEWFDVSVQTDMGEFDYQRATNGGLDAAFMSIYTSPSLEGTDKSKENEKKFSTLSVQFYSLTKIINKINNSLTTLTGRGAVEENYGL